MSETRTWNLKEVKAVIGVFTLETAGDDDFISVTRDQDFFKDGVDCNGKVYRYACNDPRGTITITLHASSQENGILSLMFYIDALTMSGIFPVIIMDMGGRDVHVAALCWFVKLPDRNYTKKSGELKWVIRCADIDSFLGGGK